MCRKPEHGEFTLVTGRDILVVERPTFTPTGGISGTSTAVSLSEQVTQGDIVVMAADCSNAHLVAQTATTVSAVLADSTRTVTIPAGLTGAVELAVCFATKESQGNEAHDFTTLGPTFVQTPVSYVERRIVQGSGAHQINVSHLFPNDRIFFNFLECTGAAPNGVSDSTSAMPAASSSSSVLVELHTGLKDGVFQLCRKRDGENTFRMLDSLELQIIGKPSFTPRSGRAGSPTQITFAGAGSGDFVVLTDTNCATPHQVVNGPASLVAGLDSQNSLWTTANMSTSGALKVCYATLETGGKRATDYVELDTTGPSGLATFYQSALHFYDVSDVLLDDDIQARIFPIGSGPHSILVTNLNAGDSVGFTSSSCSNYNSLSTATSYQTKPVTVAQAASSVTVIVNTDMLNNTYALCKQPHRGSYSVAMQNAMQIIARPTFYPLWGKPGLLTSVTLSSVAAPGDFIVMQVGSCFNAHKAVTAHNTLGKTQLDESLQFSTSSAMTSTVWLKVC